MDWFVKDEMYYQFMHVHRNHFSCVVLLKVSSSYLVLSTFFYSSFINT